MKQDNINSPNHYCLEGLDGLEVIDIIKSILGKEGFKAYCQGNVIKYVLRAKKKNGVEDLKKAIKYLEWEIAETEVSKLQEKFDTIKNISEKCKDCFYRSSSTNKCSLGISNQSNNCKPYIKDVNIK